MKPYSVAKYTTQEIVLDGQLMSAGSNQSRVLERFDKHKKSLKYQLIILKTVYSIVFAMVTLLPFFTTQEIFELLESGEVQNLSILFMASIIFTLTFGIQFLYLFLLGLFNVSSMMSGDIFRWLETMPISKDKLKKIGFMTLFRSFDLPLVVTIVLFPVLMFVRTMNLIVLITCLIISFLNIMFSFSVLVLIGERLNRIMNLGDFSSKKSILLRVFSMLSYVIISFGTAFFLQWAFSSVYIILESEFAFQSSIVFNMLLSIIPFPFAPAYLISITIYSLQLPIGIWITVIAGMGIFIFISFRAYKSAVNSLKTITSPELRMTKKSKMKEIKGESKIEIEIISPIKAYIRKDFLAATRDIQTLMYLIMPFIFPFLFGLPFLINIPADLNSIILWGIIIYIAPFISLMLTSGFIGMEESGASLLASLPIVPRDQAIAKLFIIFIIQTFSFLLQEFLFLGNINFITFLLIIPASLPMVLASCFLAFIIKVRLFGKLKYKYVVEEVHPRRKTLKWFLTTISIYVFNSIFIFSGAIFHAIFGFGFFILGIIGIGIIGLGLIYFIFNHMFPRLEKKR